MKLKKFGILRLVCLLSCILIGGFHEWGACIISIILSGYIVFRIKNKASLYIPHLLILLAIIPLSFVLNIPVAVDKGLSIFGFLKFLSIPLFYLALFNENEEIRLEIIHDIPFIGALMTVFSFLLSKITALSDFFVVNNRLSGFFQYPNTFALYLLTGIVIIVVNEKLDNLKIVALVILYAGIFLSGSRTVFIMMVLVTIAAVFINKNKAIKIVLSSAVITMIAAAVIYVLFTSDYSSVGRFITSSFDSSTLVGRFLYYKDAIPVILRHPCGLGYLGYYYSQGEFQTGVYSIMHIHNDFLQILLDIGWIPFAGVIFLIFRSFKNGDIVSRVVTATILVHSLLDFNLQYIAVDIILVAVNCRQTKKTLILCPKAAVITSVITAFTCLYFGVVAVSYYLGYPKITDKMYAYYTPALTDLMIETENPILMKEYADRILSINQSAVLAYDAEARYAFSCGDFEKVSDNKKAAIRLTRYSINEYEEYISMMNIGYQLYMAYGYEESAEYCSQCITDVPEMIRILSSTTSTLAWKITDKPELELSEESQNIITFHYERGK